MHFFPYITHTYSFIVQDKNAIKKMFSIIKRIEIILNVFERYNYKRKIRYIYTHTLIMLTQVEIIHLKKNIMKKSKTFLEMKII